eukprot:221625-Pelagomonas_calceolata.AAC.2
MGMKLMSRLDGTLAVQPQLLNKGMLSMTRPTDAQENDMKPHLLLSRPLAFTVPDKRFTCHLSILLGRKAHRSESPAPGSVN